MHQIAAQTGSFGKETSLGEEFGIENQPVVCDSRLKYQMI